MRLPNIRLEFKLLFLFVVISSIPLIIVNVVWFNSTRNQIIEQTSSQLRSTASDIANQIQTTVDTKEISLIIHSQTEAILGQNTAKETVELQNFLLQDEDLTDLTVINNAGMETLHVSRTKIYPQSELVDESNTSAFKIPTFVGGEQYISPIYFDATGAPSIFIAIPIVKPDASQDLTQLTTSSNGKSRQPGEVLGVLKANYRLTSFWNQLRNYRIEKTGYVFLVDDQGNVILHPDASFLHGPANLASFSIVSAFLTDLRNNPDSTTVPAAKQTKNELGVQSLITFAQTQPTNWGVIAEVPLSDILGQIYQVELFAVVLFLFTVVGIALTSLWLARQIVDPIKQLRTGSNVIASGDFGYRLTINSGDEIESLGKSFNQMADNLQKAFLTLEADRDVMAAERDKLSAALSSIADAVILIDRNQQIVIFNKAAEALTGVSASRAIGLPIDAVVNLIEHAKPLTSQTYSPELTNENAGIVFSRQNITLMDAAHTRHVVHITVAKIKHGESANIGAIITIHDTTQEQQLEEMKLDFVSMAAHELRTPLTSINGYLSVFIHENQPNMSEEQNKFLNRVKISTEQLIALVENLLNVSRIERGALTISKEQLDWQELVQQLVTDLQKRPKEKQITLTFVPPASPLPPVYADRIRISEVVNNLLANAINYTTPSGTVTASISQTPNEVVTFVKDSGQGIPADAIPHLFTKFFRVSGKLEQGSKGTGLGLFISKKIVDMHNGKIWVESVLGKGSTFAFSIPLGMPQSAVTPNTEQHPTAS